MKSQLLVASFELSTVCSKDNQSKDSQQMTLERQAKDKSSGALVHKQQESESSASEKHQSPSIRRASYASSHSQKQQSAQPNGSVQALCPTVH